MSRIALLVNRTSHAKGPVRSTVHGAARLSTVLVTVFASLVVLAGLPAGVKAQTSGPAATDSPAMAELREARRLAEEDPSLGTTRLIQALGGVGAWQEAERLARGLLETEPNGEHALLLALTLRRQERLDAAIDVLGEHLDDAATPTADAIRRELALLHLANGDPARALTVVEQAEAPDPGVRGLALAAIPGRSEDAARTLLHALENLDDTVVPGPELVRELGTVLLDRGEPSAALLYLRSAVDAAPDDPDAVYRLALALRALGQTEEARERLERFQVLRDAADRRDTERRTLGARLNDAQELAQQNRLEEALTAVDGVIAQYPESYSALALRAKVHFSLGKAAEALADIRRAARLEPGVSEFHYLEGLFERTGGDNSAARAALRRALALNPDLAEAHALLGGIELDLGDPAAALDHFESAVALGASGAQIERAIAIARERAGASP